MRRDMIKTIFKREFHSYFTSPVGFLFLIIFTFVVGYITFEPGRGSFFIIREASLASLFNYLPWPLLIFVPTVCMRLLAEERRLQTIEFLLTLPITVSEVVLGKYLAAFSFIALAITLTFPLIVTVFYLGHPDILVLIMGYIASYLFTGVLVAISLFWGSFTKSQVISFLLSVGGCYLFFMASSPPVLDFLSRFLPQYGTDVFESLSIITPYEMMVKGVMRLGDILFFLMMIGGHLYATVSILRGKSYE